MLNNVNTDPLLIELGLKAYSWIMSDGLSSKEAESFKSYILKNTTEDELIELKNKNKDVGKFLSGKYVHFLLC